jgi:hypothetical protein
MLCLSWSAGVHGPAARSPLRVPYHRDGQFCSAPLCAPFRRPPPPAARRPPPARMWLADSQVRVSQSQHAAVARADVAQLEAAFTQDLIGVNDEEERARLLKDHQVKVAAMAAKNAVAQGRADEDLQVRSWSRSVLVSRLNLRGGRQAFRRSATRALVASVF